MVFFPDYMNDQVKMSGSHTGLCPVLSGLCTGPARPGLSLSSPPLSILCERLTSFSHCTKWSNNLQSHRLVTGLVTSSFIIMTPAWIFVRIKRIYTRTRSPLQTTMFERKFKELIRNSLVLILKTHNSSSPSVSNKSLCFVAAHCRCPDTREWPSYSPSQSRHPLPPHLWEGSRLFDSSQWTNMSPLSWDSRHSREFWHRTPSSSTLFPEINIYLPLPSTF